MDNQRRQRSSGSGGGGGGGGGCGGDIMRLQYKPFGDIAKTSKIIRKYTRIHRVIIATTGTIDFYSGRSVWFGNSVRVKRLFLNGFDGSSKLAIELRPTQRSNGTYPTIKNERVSNGRMVCLGITKKKKPTRIPSISDVRASRSTMFCTNVSKTNLTYYVITKSTRCMMIKVIQLQKCYCQKWHVTGEKCQYFCASNTFLAVGLNSKTNNFCTHFSDFNYHRSTLCWRSKSNRKHASRNSVIGRKRNFPHNPWLDNAFARQRYDGSQRRCVVGYGTENYNRKQSRKSVKYHVSTVTRVSCIVRLDRPRPRPGAGRKRPVDETD